MLCAISGEAPEEPVVSKKTGTVFEKRLIEKYIEENGKDPVTGDELDLEDLLPIRTARVVRPRPPTLTSIPALLSTFQNEWDALALETYKLKQQLSQTREELATALYQHDAAVRVIARLTKERDEARAALSRVTVTAGAGGTGAGAAANGDAMAVDNEALPEDLAGKVDETQKKYAYSLINARCIPLLTVSFPDCRRAARSDPCQKAGQHPKTSRPMAQHHPSHCPLPKFRRWILSLDTRVWVG